MKRIKYRLLLWLLRDICNKTRSCSKCELLRKGECSRFGVLGQARKAWKLED